MKTGRLLLACVPVLLLCVVLAPARLDASSDLTEGEARLRVVVCDRVGLKASALEVAGRDLSRILRVAGIAVSVEYFADTSPADVQGQTSCNANLEGRYIPVVITHEKPTNVSGEAMGLAMRGALPRVLVFMDRLRDFANRYWSRAKGDLPVLIGHIMAHELGHLLLPSYPHTAFGIMSTGWGAQQAADAASGTLLFHKDEARAIRQGLLQQSPLSGN